jgi:hypothetical protein
MTPTRTRCSTCEFGGLISFLSLSVLHACADQASSCESVLPTAVYFLLPGVNAARPATRWRPSACASQLDPCSASCAVFGARPTGWSAPLRMSRLPCTSSRTASPQQPSLPRRPRPRPLPLPQQQQQQVVEVVAAVQAGTGITVLPRLGTQSRQQRVAEAGPRGGR